MQYGHGSYKYHFLGGWTSTTTSYFDVHQASGLHGFDPWPNMWYPQWQVTIVCRSSFWATSWHCGASNIWGITMNYWGFAICSLGTADKNRNVRCHIDLVVIYSETIPPSFALKDLFASLDTLNRQSTDTQQFNSLRKALFSPLHHDAASAENVLRHAKCSIWSCTRRRWHRWSSRNC